MMIKENRLALTVAAVGRGAARSPRSRCSRSARASSPTASRARPSASTAGGRRVSAARADRRRRGPAHRPARHRDRHRRRGLVHDRARRGARPGRRVGIGQDDGRPRAARPHAPRRARSPAAAIRVGDVDILALSSARAALGARPPRLLRAAGSRGVAQPGAAHRHPAARDARGARLRLGRRRAQRRASRRSCARSRCPTTGVPAPLPAPALGRPAAAHRPRHGVRLPPAADRARRADDRPRRHDAGARAGHRARAGARPTASPRSTSATTSPSSARSPTRVAVMYAGRIVELGATSRALRRPPAPVHAQAAAGHPAPLGPARADRHPGRAPSPGAPPAGLRVRAALHLRDRRLPRRAARRCASSTPELWVALHPRRGGAASVVTRVRRPRSTSSRRRRRAPCSRSTTSSPATAPRPSCTTSTSQLAPHECLALVGESGSGKTTLARSIAGLHRDRSGADPAARRAARASCARRARASAAGDPVRLPEPVRLAQPAQDDRPDRAPAARRASARRRAPRPTGG